MTRDEIVALLERRQGAWRRLDAAALAGDYAADATFESVFAGSVQGREPIEQVFRVWFSAFPDLDFQQLDTLIEGDRVALIWSVTGTQQGEFMGVAATGRRIHAQGVFVYDLRDGLIVSERRFFDMTGILIQAGILRAKPA